MLILEAENVRFQKYDRCKDGCICERNEKP